MDVLFVCSWFPSKLHATAGNFIERHLDAVQQKGHQVMVVHLGLSNRILIPHIHRESGSRRHVFHLFMPRIVAGQRLYTAYAKRLLKILRKENFSPQVIHGHVLFPAGPLAVAFRKIARKPLVYTEHWTGLNSTNAPKLPREVLRQVQAVAKETSFFMPVSEDLANSMQQLEIKGRYEVIYNAVDTSHFYYEDKPEREFTFLHISNFLPVKNVEGIIDAFDRLVGNTNLPVRLHIAGDGDIKRLETYAARLSSRPQMQFSGPLSYVEVASLMRKADCFVLFSHYENLPCVIAEALCCGVPVIATDVGGVPEMIDSSNGLLIKPGDTAALTTAMQKLLTQNGSNNRQISEEASWKYSFESVGSEYSRIYHLVQQEEEM